MRDKWFSRQGKVTIGFWGQVVLRTRGFGGTSGFGDKWFRAQVVWGTGGFGLQVVWGYKWFENKGFGRR